MTPGIKADIDRYVEQHVPTGGFIHAVLCNDLFRALIKADVGSLIGLSNIVWYVQNNVPIKAHGTREKVEAWLANEPEKEIEL